MLQTHHFNKYVIISTTIIFSILLLSSCKYFQSEFRYNTCKLLQRKSPIDSSILSYDSLPDRYYLAISLGKYKLNSFHNQAIDFYGLFQAEDDRIIGNSYNIIVLNNKQPINEIIETNSAGQLYIEVYKKVNCRDFKSSFDIYKEVNPNFQTLIGELHFKGNFED